ncbi:MAG: hypothetical protein ACR2ML_12340 [Solirubrobacteraceae bacterium]
MGEAGVQRLVARRAGFEQVAVEALEHEGGIASARRPHQRHPELAEFSSPVVTRSAVSS